MEKIFLKANAKFTPAKSLKRALLRKLISTKSLIKLNSRKLIPAKCQKNSRKLIPAKISSLKVILISGIWWHKLPYPNSPPPEKLCKYLSHFRTSLPLGCWHHMWQPFKTTWPWRKKGNNIESLKVVEITTHNSVSKFL